ncbi:MAG: hypothetical protein IJH47_04280 [Oscillospiraceae bacterium]|nr:hypothetical protein [Oscillospiraceae bacterium]
MKHIDFEFDGQTLALSFTMEAMLLCLERFGDEDFLEAAMAPTPEGWRECCWLAALMASQGELQRRNRGEDPRPMVTMEQLRTGLMAAEGNLLRSAVREAFRQGMTRAIPGEEEQKEINLVLQAREEEEKKKELLDIVRASWQSLRSVFTSARQTP